MIYIRLILLSSFVLILFECSKHNRKDAPALTTNHKNLIYTRTNTLSNKDKVVIESEDEIYASKELILNQNFIITIN